MRNEQRRTPKTWTIPTAVVLLTLLACGDKDGRHQAGASAGVASIGGGGTTDDASGDASDDSGDGGIDTEPVDPTGGGFPDGPGESEECAAVSQDADSLKQPADIIFVVDNSASMRFEAEEVQTKLNGFSQQIVDSGVDVHVVLISSYPDTGNGICIDAPLGSGGCPNADDNPPLFKHINHEVGSHNSWIRIIQNYADWAPVIRADASLHIVVVTDDTSQTLLTDFDMMFRALDPEFADYIHHSVVCHSNCQSAEGVGTAYINLSNLTGGVAADLCDQDFQAVFDVLSTEVISGAGLACEYLIPDPPQGQEFDPEAVNVQFTDGMGNTFEVGAVNGPADCANVADGWYYDNPASPTTIVVCPQTCDTVQGFAMGTVDIIFGCKTESAPPVG